MRKRVQGILGVAIVLIAALFAVPASAASHIGNGRIIYDSFNQTTSATDIYAMAANGSGKHVIIAGDGVLLLDDPEIAPDGQTFAYTASDDSPDPIQTHLMLADLNGQNQHEIETLSGNSIYDISWSPDGTQLAYVDYDADTQAPSLHMVNANGTNDHEVTISGLTPSSFFESVDWSSTDRLAYTFDGHGYTATVDGSAATDFANDGAWASAHVTYVSWSPDGSKLAFVAYECPSGGGGCIVIADSDGTDKRIILRDPSLVGNCSDALYQNLGWSPDGKKLLFDKSLVCG